MRNFINILKEKNLLKVIDDPVSIDLEMAHIAYIEVKRQDSKALLFTRPINGDKQYDIPVLMNAFGSNVLVELILGDIEKIAQGVGDLIKVKPPRNLAEGLEWLPKIWHLSKVPPKRTKKKGLCQEVIKQGSEVDLFDLPILKTWEKDAAPFITMGQLYTQSFDGSVHNLGMYRLQVFSKNELGLHWQIHKDSMNIYEEYRKRGERMPVSIAIGGDPLYTWCATAPLPHGIFELLLYGYIRKKRAELVKCVSNPLYVPFDVDIVIEGWVDIGRMENEGPFGDHTGFYTPIEPYPVLSVSAITSKQNPVYLATVVGKPPLEDKYLGYPTERIFLPLLKTTAPQLIDYYMPENGVFHNLILCKIAVHYPSHAQQIMHALWGVGQMSFVKHAIFVGEDAPCLRDAEAITEYILNRFCVDKMLISEGVCDALDHASQDFAKGGKWGIDCTGDALQSSVSVLSDEQLLSKMQAIISEVQELRQVFMQTANPITIVGVCKSDRSIPSFIPDLVALKDHVRIVVFMDSHKIDVNNLYMILWRVVNSIDAKRDVVCVGGIVGIDSSDKGALEGYVREWPLETDCTPSVIESLQERGLIQVDKDFLRYFQICGFPS